MDRKKPDGGIDKSPQWKVYKLHFIALIILIISICIGVREIKITDNISFLLLPITYSIVIGMAVYLSKHFKWIGDEEAKIAEGIMAILLGVIISKLAISSGGSIYMIFNVGPALILQLFGDICTIVALPVALLLGFRREAVGMASSICRDPSVAIIIDKYGISSPESRGVLFIYIVGTIIGALYMSLFASLCVSLLPLHPYAYAMASGVGSASMNAAGLVPLVNLYPSMATQLEAFAGCSNVLSTAFGIYMFIFISLPLTEKLYSWLAPILCKGHAVEFDDFIQDEDGGNNPFGLKMDNIPKIVTVFLVFSLIVAIGNAFGNHATFVDSFIGMLVIVAIAFIGQCIGEIIPYNIPSIIIICLIGMFFAIPGVPTANFVTHYASQVDLTTICAAFLAYIGIAMGKDWGEFKKIGWRGILITLVVITGTYLGSAIIANVILVLSGSI
ncbi:DUF3100 domain-containing protein [uncultured Methanobrevibacter sp.]|uniref:DUF3100 domain-containing protein n=1 Tax=uncultured Methanobrevibacter sp. TaxID=253161 RepID=UPI0025D5946F|nr:DUF3100 domain-containing protein [uncultured Methanobrevibacter sp.]